MNSIIIFLIISSISLARTEDSKRPFESYYSGHGGSVNAVIVWKNDKIVTGSSDRTIKIWDSSDKTFGAALTTINALSLVYCLASVQTDTYLASGGEDNVIRIWYVEKKEIIKTMSGHSRAILSILELKDGNLASASADNSIIIWNQYDGSIKKRLNAHNGFVTCLLQLNDNELLSGSDDGKILYWNLKTYNNRAVTIKSAVKSLALVTLGDNTKLFCAADKIYTISGQKPDNGFGEDSGKPISLYAKAGKLYSGHESGDIIEWDPSNQNSISDLFPYSTNSLPRSLALLEDKSFLISGLSDSNVRILYFKGDSSSRSNIRFKNSTNF